MKSFMSKMPTTVVLSVEVSDQDCLYRIRHVSEQCNRVVYVTVNDPSIIPEEERTEGLRIIRNLQKFPEWDNTDWTTMELDKKDGKVSVKLDWAPVHFLGSDQLLSELPRYDVCSLSVIDPPKHLMSRIILDGSEYFMKIAAFPHQLHYLSQEAGIYRALSHQCTLIPKLVGYVYEEHPERVIGILCEAIKGIHPKPQHRSQCLEALHQLHAQGLYHGDLNRYNILITPSGNVVFIDFEFSILFVNGQNELAGRMQEETKIMQNCPLDDDEEIGRPFSR